ncbi:hypothetical protein LINGRAHAP2_LOCUS31285, partial [Linum grandiflorum]
AFRLWTSLQWGISYEATILPIGDDLWLLVCASEEEAHCVIHLDRRRFNGVEVQLDIWIKEAGRSSVMENQEVAWIRTRGIPLHLRSKDLYRWLGALCAGFLCSDENSTLAYVRINIKVKPDALIPDEIPVRFGKEIFPVRIDLETPSPLSKSGPIDSFLKTWKAKGIGTECFSHRQLVLSSIASSSDCGGESALSSIFEGMVHKRFGGVDSRPPNDETFEEARLAQEADTAIM